MSESIKTGGCGKSPAIEKINKLTALTNKMQAAAALEKKAFAAEQERAKKELDRKKEIIAKFQINFKKRGDEMGIVFEQDAEGCEQDTVMLCPIHLPGTKASIFLPDGFRLMEEERKESCYPSENRPEVIWENDETIQITLQTPDKELRPEETRSAAEQMSKLLQETFPAYQYKRVYLLTEGELSVGWFLLRMEQQEREHIKAVCSIEKKMVLLTITYPETESQKWRLLARYIFLSLRLDTP